MTILLLCFQIYWLILSLILPWVGGLEFSTAETEPCFSHPTLNAGLTINYQPKRLTASIAGMD